ncbi:MAG TPA: BolA/IbaG family iron-sulfur metabolism protein [Gammaproteobacteria bacterium]|nr:BolA/IbaG family iron-sulfur metabolism protein [Gammaproteobacteria bacterium]
MNSQEIAALIRQGLPAARIEVESDDDTHFAALVVSEAFAGLRPLQRHQLVYRALGDRMGGEIHALSIRALTPAELADGA